MSPKHIIKFVNFSQLSAFAISLNYLAEEDAMKLENVT